MSPVSFEGDLYHSGSFFEQVTQFCNGIGFAWESGTVAESKFQAVTLFRHSKKVLTIVLIDYNNWLLSEALNRYEVAFEYVSGIRQQGTSAVILWEDQWVNSQKIVISRVKALLGISVRIPGRLTYQARIDKSSADSFLNQHHLQGNVSSKYRYGLFLPVRYFRVLPEDFSINDLNNDLLVAVATYSNAKIFPRDGYSHRSCELIRFANHCDTTVVGGIDKMVKAFVTEFQPDDIMTYADLEWSDGASYQKLGFEYFSHRTAISFFLNMQEHTRHTSNLDVTAGVFLPITNAGSKKFVKRTKN
jgi:hypothetical protein